MLRGQHIKKLRQLGTEKNMLVDFKTPMILTSATILELETNKGA
ncbi:hypothetical protein JFPO13_contig000028-0009 [Edwardsiella piscicida]|nr:hypothetical protein JFPO13_contig000028-0009 [Edwardsiella piscicida]